MYRRQRLVRIFHHWRRASGKAFNRGNGEIILTEIGEVVYKRAKEILSLEQQMLREVEHIKIKECFWLEWTVQSISVCG